MSQALMRRCAMLGSVVGIAAAGWLPGAAAAALPDGRAYELVSPSAKNGGDVLVDTSRSRASGTGDAVSFPSLTGFADVRGGGVAVEYLSQRAGAGWQTHAITPRQEPRSLLVSILTPEPAYHGEFADDLSAGVFRAFSPPAGDASNTDQVENLYVRRDLRTPGQGSYELLTGAEAPIAANPFYIPFLAGASRDFSHVIFEATENLTSDASGFGAKLYEWDNGTVRLAGILPASEGGGPAPVSLAGRGAGASNPVVPRYTPNTISADGARIFFTGAPDFTGIGQLYMRVDHADTVRINASEKAVPDPTPSAAAYESATPDGSQVFFTSAEQLTEDDANSVPDLYVYDTRRPDSSPDNLTRISTDRTEGDVAGDVIGAIGVSDDGAYAYFIAAGGALGGERVYLAHAGEVRQIGKLAGGVFDRDTNVLGNSWFFNPKNSRVTPDGKHLVFVSEGSDELTGYDNGDGCFEGAVPGCLELYVYSADSDELACASCNPSGAPAETDVRVRAREGSGGADTSSHLNRVVTDDGSRVFFSTGDRLVDGDQNGNRYDTYVYDVRTGQHQLISSGRSRANSYFVDAGRNGNDLFFATRDRLVGWDTDDSYDVYDARVGGGFAEPPPVPEQCAGEGCRPQPNAAPVQPAIGSAEFIGEGGQGDLPPEVPVFFVAPLTRRQQQRWAATGSVLLTVQTSQGGRVQARVRARIGRATRDIARATKTVAGGGKTSLRLTLSRAARRHLRKGLRLRVTVTVRYSLGDGAQTATLTLVNSRAGRNGSRQ